MIPFVVLLALFCALFLLGQVGVAPGFGWWGSLRFALAGMFLVTASAHWGRRRPDLIRMVPPAFPRPDLIVTLTGVLEIAGATGLMFARTAPYAGIALCALLLAMFPANVHAARQHLSIGGRSVMSILPRGILQLIFVGA
ncbi:MAG TPA: hypothetical protein VEQ63_06445, partial [Bryobacteraceae bacterium]|nr:hypothetical protein [Bryobacteraceae bacterium]